MLGDRVREYRKKRGWKQQLLAEYVGTTQSVISEIENGTRSNLTRDLLDRLAGALGVSVAALLSTIDMAAPPVDLLRATGYTEDLIVRLVESWPRQPESFRSEVWAAAQSDYEALQELTRRRAKQEARLRDMLGLLLPVLAPEL